MPTGIDFSFLLFIRPATMDIDMRFACTCVCVRISMLLHVRAADRQAYHSYALSQDKWQVASGK